MQTNFTERQLIESRTQVADKIIRSCVHCGFCLSACPTYKLLGDELDSPRGRIYLIKNMLEKDEPATEQVVKHIDRCLSCLSCMSTCPSDVNYMHLIDSARQHIERTYRRPLGDQALRRLFGIILPRPRLFGIMLRMSRLVLPFAKLMPISLRAILELMPKMIPKASGAVRAGVIPSTSLRSRRVILLTGCAQQVLAPQINEASIRLLTRHGCDVVIAPGSGCCGALNYHLGQSGDVFARANIQAWSNEIEAGSVDAIIINTSGCGTTIKDYGFLFRDDPELAAKARTISSLARDITEFVSEIGLQPNTAHTGLRVAYHSACSLQHGQRVRAQPKQLLTAAGFVVVEPLESDICCGSAGTYNLLQPVIAGELRKRKVSNIEKLAPDLVATGNIGCITQISNGTSLPVVHTIELLDWATGGPRPLGIEYDRLRQNCEDLTS
jgi:glycolate oxidase iron-sulfur subunit